MKNTLNKIKRKLRTSRDYIGGKFYRNNENKFLKIQLKWGLCNKLHCLFSACDIALKEGYSIIEPDFGWRKSIRFSDIYDIDYFNKVMSKYNNGKDLMIPKDKVSRNKYLDFLNFKIVYNKIDLYNYSEKELTKERGLCEISSKSTKLRVLGALKLKREYVEIVDDYLSNNLDIGLQIRTESDWRNYAKVKKTFDKKELVLVELEDIMKMIPKVIDSKNIFFTSGENHTEIIEYLEKLNYTVSYFYNPNLEYEINAAINFEICCNAKNFIGNSRSSYSTLVAYKRAIILENDNSYIYNYDNKLHLRKDKGLYGVAYETINKKTIIV
jgi:hypothetical protein